MAFAGVTSVRSPGAVETNSTFRRSQSRVFYQSDCSSPTSWEFREAARTAAAAAVSNMSFRRASGSVAGEMDSCAGAMNALALSLPLEQVINSPKVDLRGTDGSRNSTGSSGSHRSQDSGFSDSGETRATRQQGSSRNSNSNKTHHSHSNSQNGSAEYWTHSHRKSPSVLSIPPSAPDHHHTCHQRQQHSHCLSPPDTHRHYSTTHSPADKLCANVNGQVITNGSAHFHISQQQQDCSNYIYHNGHDQVCSPVDRPRSGLLGTPACCSTPKRTNGNISLSTTSIKIGVMQKIDNFESLNKNVKTLDSNNNSKTNNNNINFNPGSQHNSNHDRKSGHMNANHNHASSATNTNLNARSLVNGHATYVRSTSSSSSTGECHGMPNGVVGRDVGGSVLATCPPAVDSNGRSVSSSPACKSVSTSPRISPVPFTRRVSSSAFCTGTSDDVILSGTIRAASPPKSSTSPDRIEEEEEDCPVNELSSHASRSKVFSKNNSKWQSLPKGYKRVPLNSFSADAGNSFNSSSRPGTANTDDLIVVKSHFDNDAMRQWLHDLRQQTESECLHTLQNKSILTEAESRSYAANFRTSQYGRANISKTCAAIHAISSPLQSIKNVETMASVISGEFARICKHLEFGMLTQVPYSVVSLVDNIGEFLRQFQDSRGFGNLVKLENRLATSCCELRASAHSLSVGQNLMSSGGNRGEGDPSTDSQPQNIYSVIPEPDAQEIARQDYQNVVGDVVEGVVSLGNLFSQVVDLRLTRDLSAILDTVEGGGLPAKVALRSFSTVLSDGGMHLCRLASDIRTVRGLLGALLDATDEHEKILSLRCLATVLCVGEAVKDFDKAGGFEIIADLLCEPSYGMRLKVEAVSVLTQATDPWIDLESTLGSLGIQLEKIIVSLTNLISYVRLEEDSFLLVVAAISNLTFLEVASLDILRRCRTVTLLTDAVQNKQDFSIFVLDHVATILANMGGMESCRGEIVRSGGIFALLTFLEKRPSSTDLTPEITACERLQQKSAIALSRLANEDGVAQFVLRMGGIQRLVQLSRNEKERNYSDGVLIACLATLRKLVTICGYDIVKQLNADDLIHPRLLDSFLLYSSRQESYV